MLFKIFDELNFNGTYRMTPYIRNDDHSYNVMEVPKFVRIEPGHVIADPVAHGLDLSRDDMQELMNELWRHGIRPSEGRELPQNALLSHIDDLRKNNDRAMDLVYKLTDNLIK